MKIALAQFNPTVGDFEGNSARILELARQARAGGAEVAVFSELCLCGYPPQDLIERPAFIQRNHDYLGGFAGTSRSRPLSAMWARRMRNRESRVANLAALIADGKILFEQQKMLLPTYDVFDETRYFQPALTQHAFLLDGETLGVTICEDIWNDKTFWTQRLYARDPVTELVGKGSSIILNISSSPYTIDKRAIRQDMLRAMARRHQVPVVYVNQVGGNDSLVFDGSSVRFFRTGAWPRWRSPSKKIWYFSIAPAARAMFVRKLPMR